MEIFYKQFSDNIDDVKINFYEELEKAYNEKKWNTLIDQKKYNEMLEEYKAAKSTKFTKSTHQYYLLKHYDVMKIGDNDKLVIKVKNVDDIPLTIAIKENLFDILLKFHYETGHGRRDKMNHAI